MKNTSFYTSFTALALLAFTSGILTKPGLSMDHSSIDMEPHLTYLRKTLNEHGFHPCHFCLASESESVKIFDIKEQQQQRTLDIHASHPKKGSFEHTLPNQLPEITQPTQTVSIYSRLWNMLPSMPTLWSRSTPAPETNVPSSLTVSSFYVIPDNTPQNPLSSSTPVLETYSPEKVEIIDNYSWRSSDTDPIELGLSLRGGGGRGYMEALWLQHLEKEANAPVWQIFDSIAGVSIGGILALGAANPNMKQINPIKFFTTEFPRVFPKTAYWNIPVRLWDSARSIFYPQYDPNPLEALLQEEFGPFKLNETLTDVIVTAVDTKDNELCAFNRNRHGDLPAWQVARASSAAPTYFKAYEIEGTPYIDGGIGENNPVLRLLMRMRELAQQRNQSLSLDKITVLSLGTGDMPVNSIPNEAGLSSAERIISACMDVQSNAADMTARSLVPNLIICNPKLSKAIPLNILGPEELEILGTAASTQYEVIEKFAQSDVVRRRLESYKSIF